MHEPNTSHYGCRIGNRTHVMANPDCPSSKVVKQMVERVAKNRKKTVTLRAV